MKILKTFEMWTTDVSGNFDVNYGDKVKLSDVAIEARKFIEDNYDKIDSKSTNSTEIEFDKNLRFKSIKIYNNSDVKYLHFFYHKNNDLNGYIKDITDEDYEYLVKYFLKVYKEQRLKNQKNIIKSRDKTL